MNVCYATDDNYAPMAGVSILSLLENNREEDEITVYLLDNHLSEENRQKLRSITEAHGRNLIFVNVDQVEQLLRDNGIEFTNYDGQFTLTYFFRLWMDQLVPEEVKRLIYLDCDTLIVDSLRPLYDLPLTDQQALAAMADCTRNEYKDQIKLSRTDNYYNSGVLLMDLVAWKKLRCSERILDHMQQVRAIYPLPDQDLINVVLKDNIRKGPLRFNLQSPNRMFPTWDAITTAYALKEEYYYGKREHDEAQKHPAVLHFSGMSFNRPWFANSNHPDRKLYRSYYARSPWANVPMQKNQPAFANRVRGWMYRLLIPPVNARISGPILKRWIYNTYLDPNCRWYNP